MIPVWKTGKFPIKKPFLSSPFLRGWGFPSDKYGFIKKLKGLQIMGKYNISSV